MGSGCWCSPGRMPRSLCPTSITRSARSMSRRGRPGSRISSSTCCSRGPSGSPRGRIGIALAFVAAGHSNAETGEDATHYWFAFPSHRWELALAIEADRMRGASFDPREVEAVSGMSAYRRGAAPATSIRPSAGSTRPTWPLPTCGTPTATRSWAGPKTWQGSRSTTSGRSTTAITAPTARCW